MAAGRPSGLLGWTSSWRVEQLPGGEGRELDVLRAHLRGLGIDAQIAPGGPSGQHSLGLLDIKGGRIVWLDVQKVVTNMGGHRSSADYRTLYGVPDPRIGSGFPEVRIKSVQAKNFPLIGHAVDVRWKGKDFGMDIIARLNGDSSLKSLAGRGGNIEISLEYNCWLVLRHGLDTALSEERWQCYQAIAEHLLATPVPSSW